VAIIRMYHNAGQLLQPRPKFIFEVATCEIVLSSLIKLI
jgi:hypothetical protein